MDSENIHTMNTLRNQVQLIGNIGSELNLTKTKSDRSLLKFSLATNDYHVSAKGERTKETQWHRIVAWGKQAEYIANTMGKGAHIAVNGKLTYNSFEGSDGKMKYFTEIKINTVENFSRTNKPKLEEEMPF